MLLCVLCVSVCRKTVYVYLTPGRMKYRGLKGEGGVGKKKKKQYSSELALATFFFFIQETGKKGSNTPDTYIPEKQIMEGGKKMHPLRSSECKLNH